MSDFYSKLLSATTDPLQGFISSTASTVIGAITPVATTLLMIYVLFWGWSMIRGVISEPITDGVTRIVKLAVICGIALSFGLYSQFLVDWLWQSPDRLASMIAGGKPSDKVNFLDAIFEKIWGYAEIWNTAASNNSNALGIPDLGQFFMAWIIRIVGALMTGYAAFLFVLAKIALAILLAIGPIFILVTMFESSRKFFDSWIAQCLNFCFVIILTAAILKIVGTYIDTSVTSAGTNASGGDPAYSDGFFVVIMCGICFVMMLQVMSIASGISGGAAISTLGSVGWAYAKIRGASSQAYRLGSGKSLSEWRGRRRQAAVNARWAANNPSLPARAAAAAARRVRGERNNTVAKN